MVNLLSKAIKARYFAKYKNQVNRRSRLEAIFRRRAFTAIALADRTELALLHAFKIWKSYYIECLIEDGIEDAKLNLVEKLVGRLALK
jgi:hypothetical protein